MREIETNAISREPNVLGIVNTTLLKVLLVTAKLRPTESPRTRRNICRKEQNRRATGSGRARSGRESARMPASLGRAQAQAHQPHQHAAQRQEVGTPVPALPQKRVQFPSLWTADGCRRMHISRTKRDHHTKWGLQLQRTDSKAKKTRLRSV
eukprot:3178332-Pleurochrysis_carterae.AAC.3